MRFLVVGGAVVVLGCLAGIVYQAVTYEPVPESSDSPPARGPFPWGMVMNWALCAFITGLWWLGDRAGKLAGYRGLEPEVEE